MPRAKTTPSSPGTRSASRKGCPTGSSVTSPCSPVTRAGTRSTGSPTACRPPPALAAVIVEPFVSEENHWIVKHHGIFQGYYFFHHLGLDRNLRDRYRDHTHWEACADFCAAYDQNSFDPGYDTLSLEFFEPMVRRVFAAPKRSLYLPNEG